MILFYSHHIHQHAQDTNHYLAMDLSYGQTYCFHCQDYVYDKQVEQIAQVRNQSLLVLQRTIAISQRFYHCSLEFGNCCSAYLALRSLLSVFAFR